MSKKSILQWCKEQHDAGKELTLRWEGGGDSGWAYFEIDGKQEENEYTEALVDHIYNILDYGSWAGEFSASGEAIFNPTTNSFEGVDHYGEDNHNTINCEIKLEVPKSLWFESLHIECECSYDETPNVSVQFHIKNGFLVSEHLSLCETLEKDLKENFEELFDNYEGPEEFRGCNESWFITRDEFVIQDEMLVFTMKSIEIQTMTSEEKDIVMELNEETVEYIDKILNEKNAEV